MNNRTKLESVPGGKPDKRSSAKKRIGNIAVPAVIVLATAAVIGQGLIPRGSNKKLTKGTPTELNTSGSPFTLSEMAELPTVSVTAQQGDGTWTLTKDVNGIISNPVLMRQAEEIVDAGAVGTKGVIQENQAYDVPVLPKSLEGPGHMTDIPASDLAIAQQDLNAAIKIDDQAFRAQEAVSKAISQNS